MTTFINGRENINLCFENLKHYSKDNSEAKKSKSALICFITCGFPTLSASLELMKVLSNCGCDIIELGMPFSDPMADGTIIQKSSAEAIKNGVTITTALNQIKEFRNQGYTTPVVLMGYYNPIYRYNEIKFAKDANEAGADGLIVVDTPPEEDRAIKNPIHDVGMSFIRLATPTSNTERLKLIVAECSGYLYYVSVTGTTGLKSANEEELYHSAKRIKSITTLPIAVGFGIKSSEQVMIASKYFNAVVCGSALIETISTDNPKTWSRVSKFVSNLNEATLSKR